MAKKTKPKEKSKGGRPEYLPTAKDRGIVEVMSAGGIPQDLIAACMGIHHDTLRKHYTQELSTAKSKLDAEVVGQLIKKIRAGDTACIIFYLKTRMKWQETAPQEDDHARALKFKQAMQEMNSSVPAPNA